MKNCVEISRNRVNKHFENGKHPLVLLLLLNVVIYIPIIIILNDFYSDDYLLFSVIVANEDLPISINTNEVFFLFMRPLSYFSFWIDYHLWNTNPIPMKVFSLMLHLILISFLYRLFEKTANVFFGKVNYKLIFILLLLLSFHLDSMIWIYWIANRTELLYILFYVISIYNVLRFFQTERSIYLSGYIIFYLFSILSKQQGLHLPILVLVISLFIKKNIAYEITKKIILTSSVLIVVMVVYSYINYTIFYNTVGIEGQLWKKPFSLLGIFMYSILPGISESIYEFFLFNKIYAYVLLAFLMLLLTSLFYLKKFGINRSVVLIISIVCIVYYPRILAVGAGRINSIIVLWIIVSVFFISMYFSERIKSKHVSLYLFSFFILLFSINLIFEINKVQMSHQTSIHRIELLNKKYKDKINRVIVIGGFDGFYINEYLYFCKNNLFGRNKGNHTNFVNYSLIGEKYLNGKVDAIRGSDNNICLKSLDEHLYFVINEPNTIKPYVVETISTKGNVRGYSSICFKINPKHKGFFFVFFNGIGWEEITL